MITTLGQDIPRDIRRAVEGSLSGWHRLQRFQTAMAFPTIAAAAAHLGAHQSALVHQLKRLERDIGARLYQPAAPNQPMQPAPRGTALLKALRQPGIQPLLAGQARTPDGNHAAPAPAPAARARTGPVQSRQPAATRQPR